MLCILIIYYIDIVGSITSRCSGNEPALTRGGGGGGGGGGSKTGLEKTAEIEPIDIVALNERHNMAKKNKQTKHLYCSVTHTVRHVTLCFNCIKEGRSTVFFFFFFFFFA